MIFKYSLSKPRIVCRCTCAGGAARKASVPPRRYRLSEMPKPDGMCARSRRYGRSLISKEDPTSESPEDAATSFIVVQNSLVPALLHMYAARFRKQLSTTSFF